MSAADQLARPILLVGCGKMGGALLAGWRERKIAASYIVIEPGTPSPSAHAREVTLLADPAALAPDAVPQAIVFAVKPQSLDQVAPAYRRFAAATPFLSIAAGKTLAYFARQLGAQAAVVRAMPNTPAAIGRGIAVACASPRVDPAARGLCDRLLAAVGEVAWVEDEGLLDAVTAVSGSGPAYVFLLIECLAQAGVEAGLPQALALQLARATVAGAGELARQSSESAASLREAVTSPGGTTRAALDVLMAADGLEPLLRKAVAAATRRSRELAD
ncbi:MAG TPA: pyrroline-5-carboxylate reductase [Stellaceae bacterium]|nr:pyrroline-5-carboxylate reductase [Stellaceae bacterium]